MFSRALNNKPVSFLIVAVLMLLIIPGIQTLQGQTTSATLSGIVKDETGAVLPGVSISIRNEETGSVRTAVTDDTGLYRVPLLEPGTYEIRAELTGFQTMVQTGVKLDVGRSAAINLALSVGAITDEVIVTGEAPLVETTSTALAGLVDDKKIRDLPLNGRSFEQLAFLQPGVTRFHFSLTPTVTGSGAKFSTSGGRPNQNSFMLDGVRINDGTNGTPGSSAGNNLGVEAIREFKVLTNTYSAAQGFNSGAIVNVVTKSGTNELHGSVFWFHRNDNLDARNFFDPGESPPEFKRNQFGFSLGGPIKEDQTFIFGSYEGLREGLGLSNLTTVPSLDARSGIGPWGTIMIPPDTQPWVDLYPLPNGRDFGDGTAEFFSGEPKTTDEDYFSIRFDHHFSAEDSLFVRYTFDEANVLAPDEVLVTDDVFFSRNQSFVTEYKKIFSPNLINTARFGINRTFGDLKLEARKSLPPPFVPGTLMGRITIGVVTGRPPVANLGGTQGAPYRTPYTTFQYADDLNWTRGTHGIQIGTGIMRIQNNMTNLTGVGRGQFSFTSLENFLRGAAQLVVADTPGSTRDRATRQTHFGFYIQDDIRYRPNLTFNLGFRWEFMTEISDAAGRQSQQTDHPLGDFIVGRPLYNFTGHQLQPRIGLAWDPFGDGKTSIRAGTGIFNDQMGAQYYNVCAIHPFAVIGIGFAPRFPGGVDDLTGATPITCRIEPDVEVPQKLHFNLNIQQQVSSNTVFTVAYVGSRGSFLPRLTDGNQPIPTIRADGKEFWTGAEPRANPNLDYQLNTTSDVNSFYHSLQLSLNRRFAQNLQYQFSYTWGHSIDDGSQQSGSESRNALQMHSNPRNRKFDRSHSTFDVRHNFVANATWDLPIGRGQRWGDSATGFGAAFISGWQLNTIVSIASGVPQNITVGFNNARNKDFLFNPDRPDLAPGRSDNPVLGGPDQYYDPTAFVVPEAGVQGEVARTSVIGPGFSTVDVAITKNTVFTENGNVQFRAEFFNIFNRANFGSPAGIVFRPGGVILGNAGRITNTVSTSRQIQLAVKITF